MSVHQCTVSVSPSSRTGGRWTVSFARFGAPGGAPGHNRYDLIEHLSPDNSVRTTEFVRKFSEKLVNAYVFPVPSKMPENMVETVDKYLKRNKYINDRNRMNRRIL